MNEDDYKILTPYGIATATFPPEDDDGYCPPVIFGGDAFAIQHIRNLFEIGITGEDGHAVTEANLSPDTLYRFVPTDKNGVIVLPPFEMLSAHLDNKR